MQRLTQNPIYEEAALRALNALWDHRSTLGLVGNHVNVETGQWIAADAGIGAAVDSYLEYLVKGSALLSLLRFNCVLCSKNSAWSSFNYLNA